MRMLEPVEVSSRPWICSYGYAPSHCGYAPARTSYDGYAPMDMLLPTVDMPRPGYAPMDMLLPIVDRPLLGYAPMDMLLWIRCHGYVPLNYGYASTREGGVPDL